MSDQQHAEKFEVLVLPHLDAAYNLARWITRNDQDARDVVQEAYMRAFRFFDGFHGDNARAWLLTIVRNTCYSWLQRNREQDVSLDELHKSAEADDGVFAEEQSDDNPETQLLRTDDRNLVNRAIEQLPPEFREVLVMRELEELSYREIAAVADIPIGTVMSRLARARKLLLKHLKTLTQEP